MSAIKVVVLASLVSCLGSVAYAAATVGTCTSATHPYPTISAAITASAAYGVVNVCPGTYAEQLVIDKPLTVNGLVVAGQSGVTITAPATGLMPVYGSADQFAQVYVNNAGGPVVLSNLSVTALGALVNTRAGQVSPDTACALDGGRGTLFADFAGVRYVNTAGSISHLNLSGQFGLGYADTGGPGGEAPVPDAVKNCGAGIEMTAVSPTEQFSVQSSVVGTAGICGICLSSGTVNQNIVTVSGPYAIGIKADVITNNTITASYNINTAGIKGGRIVQSNLVQQSTYGIDGAVQATHNTLLNNSIGIVSTNASENLIDSAATYADPTCPIAPTNPQYGQCFKPTVGIDLGCTSGNNIQNNGIVGVGTGLANVSGNRAATAPSNLFASVATMWTSCQ